MNQPKKPHDRDVPQPDQELKPNPAVDEFLSRLTKDIRHAKPGQEAVSAALQAIHRMALEADSEAPASSQQFDAPVCTSCGATNRPGHRFCSTCGVPLHPPANEALEVTSQPPVIALPQGEHHYHHHYHHHYFSSTEGVAAAEPRVAAALPRDRSRTAAAGAGLSRAEAAVRKLAQDWALACNSKHLDDLVELYVADAIVLRPNYPAVRGTAAIREFFCGLLDAGLGDVELEPVRTEILGEVGYDAGRCKSLVPAVGKRREDRGKYLLLSVRQNAEWKIVADCWSTDLGLETGAPPVTRR